MTVLVTGGAGYIGSHMVHALAEAGESVVVIDNLSTGFSAFLPEGVPLFIGDAGAENLVEGVIAQHGVESIIHFAGSVVVPDSMRDPLGYYRNNTMTTRSLLNAAVKGGISRFIFSSTAAVYGRGYSRLRTSESVRPAAFRNFAVQYAPRRPGGIMTMVAGTSRIRSTLDWTPRYDDLDTIAAHALAWEEKLFRDRGGLGQHA